MLTRFSADAIEAGAVTVVLSGDRPIPSVAREQTRLVAIDGRLADLDRNPSPSLVPLVSAPWKSCFEWDGRDAMPPDELQSLLDLAAKARAQERMLRFWGAPDRQEAWEALRAARVDWINTDQPRDFAMWASGDAR
jgi:hypothetical protein